MFTSQLPNLAPGELERWILSAAAVGGMVLMGLRLFGKGNGNGNGHCTKEEFRHFQGLVEQDLGGLRDRIDSRHLDVIQRLEILHTSLVADAERRSEMLQKRVAGVEAAVERLDERTCRGRAES